jgi:hypothetical protein
VGREDIVGLAAQQQVQGRAEDFAEGGAERFIEVGRGPAAQREAAGRVFLPKSGGRTWMEQVPMLVRSPVSKAGTEHGTRRENHEA